MDDQPTDAPASENTPSVWARLDARFPEPEVRRAAARAFQSAAAVIREFRGKAPSRELHLAMDEVCRRVAALGAILDEHAPMEGGSWRALCRRVVLELRQHPDERSALGVLSGAVLSSLGPRG
jgi:hypothetical protein